MVKQYRYRYSRRTYVYMYVLKRMRALTGRQVCVRARKHILMVTRIV
jgi:hypothetical protein